jgi:hypothetical protein
MACKEFHFHMRQLNNGFGVVDPIESIVLGPRSAQIFFFNYPLEVSVGQGRNLFKWRAMGEGNGYKPWENASYFSISYLCKNQWKILY